MQKSRARDDQAQRRQQRGSQRISDPSVFLPFVPSDKSAGFGEMQECGDENHDRRYSGGAGRMEYQQYAVFQSLIEG